MSVYILDLEYQPASDRGRKWEQLVPEPTSVMFDDPAQPNSVIQAATRMGVVASTDSKDLIVVHRTSIKSNPEGRARIRECGIPVLVVSGESQTPFKDLQENEACYYRKTRVLMRSEGVDKAFHDLFLKFWTKYQQPEGELDWSLLEPEPWPRHLVALYLVAKSLELSEGAEREAILSGWNTLASRDRIWQEAVGEYRSRGGAINKWPGPQHGTDPSCDFDIDKAVAEIGKVLSPR